MKISRATRNRAAVLIAQLRRDDTLMGATAGLSPKTEKMMIQERRAAAEMLEQILKTGN